MESGAHGKQPFAGGIFRFVFLIVQLCLLVEISLAQQEFLAIARAARAEAEREVRRQNEASRARSAARSSGVDFLAPLSPFGMATLRRRRPRRTLSTAEKFARVHGARSVSQQYHDAARVFQIASNLFLERVVAMVPSAALTGAFRNAMFGICPRQIICGPVDVNRRYRRADGICNNLYRPLQGSQSTPQPRLLFAAYEDVFHPNEPRQHGIGGFLLPSARFVSNNVHRGIGSEMHEPDITLLLMQWGQFTDHDIVITPIPKEGDDPIECCDDGVPASVQHEACFHITLPGPPPGAPPDPYFPPSITCLNFVRSTAAINSGCIPGQRQQLNKLTSYIDASNVYGSTREEQEFLRTMIGGRLKEMPPERNLPEDTRIPFIQCDDIKITDYCLLAGDERVMEQPSLSMIHTVFMREHNRIASILESLHPFWDDERIFQEARKIVAAEMQHITYNEYLPLILGPAYMNFFGLYSRPSGFSYVYSPFIDASIVNVFAAASYRYGHSQIPNELAKTDFVNGPIFDNRPLDDTFFQSNMILKPNGADRLARYAATANSQAVDSRIEQSVRNKLFKDLDVATNPFDSLDLAALNIQRGRDHGLPPYNAYRVLCGLRPYQTWQDAMNQDHSDADLARLQNAYRDPRDIDMFAGAMSERPVPGGFVGRTNACIIGNQFRRLKRGDRFFYENPFPWTGFSFAQLNSIKRITLAKIICTNTNTPSIQRNVFRKAGIGNPLVNCDILPGVDIQRHWAGGFANLQLGYQFHLKPPMTPVYLLRPKTRKNFLVPKIWA